MHWIRQFLKQDLRYNYKRGGDRNIRAKDPWSIYKQAMFSCYLFEEIRSDALIASVDESSFSRSVKSNYFWLPSNRSSGIVNVTAQGRTSMIWALLSNGSWMWTLMDDTVTAQDFKIFLFLLKLYISSNWTSYAERIVLMMDNASIHLTTSNQSIAERHGMKILGLPPYWPYLAPVEFVFGVVKGHIKNSNQIKEVDFVKSSGKRAIASGLEYLTKEKVLNMWRRIIKIARETITDAYELIHCMSKVHKLKSDSREERKQP